MSNDDTEPPGEAVRYFEDYVPASVWELGSVSVSEAEIVEFARSYDPQPFHTDAVAALDGPFGGLIASGWQTCVLSMQRFVPGYLSAASSLGSPAIDELRFPAPVRPGDRLSVVATVLDARESSTRPDRGIVRTQLRSFTADGVLVLSMIIVNLIRRAP
jgi:acyl dehydratase